MQFLNELEQAIEPIFQKIITHPFNLQLANGSLPEEKFRFYISQDMYYIGEDSRAIVALAAKAPSHSQMMEFVEFAKEGLEIERALHTEFGAVFHIQYPEKIALTTEAYANFLLSTVAYKSFPEAMAAILPCFWLYNKVAAHIYENAAQENNKYQKWIDTYSGAAFDETTRVLKESTASLAEENNENMRKAMIRLFVRSSEYEWLFWDAAYHMRYGFI